MRIVGIVVVTGDRVLVTWAMVRLEDAHLRERAGGGAAVKF